MTPFDDFVYLINHVLLGEEPTIEDFILLVGTLVAFIAFILWCCFPIQPKEPGQHRQFTCKIIQNHIKAFDAAPSTEATGAPPTSNSANNNASNSANNSSTSINNNSGFLSFSGASNTNNNTQYNGSGNYSKNGTIAMHNYYVKNGHHCCT